jgi:DNA polymerase alpha subunit A
MLRCCQILLLNVQEEDAEIYDEVTEDQYKSVVQGRLAKDDFVP